MVVHTPIHTDQYAVSPLPSSKSTLEGQPANSHTTGHYEPQAVSTGLQNFLAPQPELSSDHLDKLTDQVVLDALVQAGGVCKLAAEKLCVQQGIPTNLASAVSKAIPSIVSVRLPELKTQMETLATLELFSLMPLLNRTLRDSLSSLAPGETVTAYMKLMELIAKKTDANELNININDRRFATLPRNIQQLYTQLEASGQLTELVEHTGDSSDVWHTEEMAS